MNIVSLIHGLSKLSKVHAQIYVSMYEKDEITRTKINQLEIVVFLLMAMNQNDTKRRFVFWQAVNIYSTNICCFLS